MKREAGKLRGWCGGGRSGTEPRSLLGEQRTSKSRGSQRRSWRVRWQCGYAEQTSKTASKKGGGFYTRKEKKWGRDMAPNSHAPSVFITFLLLRTSRKQFSRGSRLQVSTPREKGDRSLAVPGGRKSWECVRPWPALPAGVLGSIPIPLRAAAEASLRWGQFQCPQQVRRGSQVHKGLLGACLE